MSAPTIDLQDAHAVATVIARHRAANNAARAAGDRLVWLVASGNPAGLDAAIAEHRAAEQQCRTTWAEMERLGLIDTYVDSVRRGETTPAEVVVTVRPDTDVVSRSEHNAAVKREVDWGWRLGEQLDVAKREIAELREQLDMTAAGRVSRVLADLREVPRSRTARHDDTCWQRHPGCLARRVVTVLVGEEVA